MSHREVLEALSGLLLAMFVAMLSSTVVSNALPAHRHRPPRQPDRLHLGRRRHPAGHDRDHADLGQARRPVQQEAARAERARHLLDRLADRRLRAEHGGADRRPRDPGPRRRRPDRAGPGRHREHGHPARARPLLRLHRRRLRARHGLRPAHRWPHRRHPRPRLALVLLRRPARRRRGVRRCSRRRCTCPSYAARSTSTTSAPPCIVGGVSLLLVWVSLAGNQFGWTSATSVGCSSSAASPCSPPPSTSRRGSRSSRSSRCACSATGPRRWPPAASVLIGVAMFGSTVYLSQYFQLARGMSPTHAGLMSIAMVGGLVVSSMTTGRIITRTGVWKRYLVGGMVAVIVGLSLLRTIDATTPCPGRCLHGGPRPRPRRDHAEPRAGGAEQHRPGRHGRGQLAGRVLPQHGRLDRRLGAGRGAQPPGGRQGRRRASPRSGVADELDSRATRSPT